MFTIAHKAALLIPVFASSAAAICAGSSAGIGNLITLSNNINQWNIYDNNCDTVDSLSTNQNPCTVGIFGCSPAPIIFNHYTSSINGTQYSCVADPASESCGSNSVSVCCVPA